MPKLDQLLQQELTRKQFLITLLTTIAGLFGLSTLLGLFTKNSTTSQSFRPGYGRQDYGP